MLSRRKFKISFCTTCKNRLWQLSQTLGPNLDAIYSDACAEIVLVNYNSQDGLDNWVRQFRREIDLGIMRYIFAGSELYFHCSKAKNLAHFAASGDFVVNLDADNYIGNTIPLLRSIWRQNYNALIQGFCGSYKDGTYGRIGLARSHFLALGGYDEAMLGIGHHDRDLIARAQAAGLDYYQIKQKGLPAIPNSVAEKMRYADPNYTHREMVQINSARLENNLRTGRLVVNEDRRPRRVLMNFMVKAEL